MLYALGDSFTYGFNFKNKRERVESVWPTHLANLLSVPCKNLALPGASNWRMARQLLSLPLTKDDIVVAALTTYVRFEFGVNKKHKMPPANLPGDINEVDGDMITKRFFPQLTERTTCEATKTFNTLAFDTFCNELWFGQMHHVMCSAIAYRLQAVGCRGILFNAWSDHNPIVDVPYFLLPGTTMHKAIELPELAGTPIQYWSKQQHQSIADILYRHLNGEQIESPINNYNASTDLDNFY